MSEGSYLKADVMCPFYLSDDRRGVLCEGVMQGAVTVQQFRRREDLVRFMRLRCCRRVLRRGCVRFWEANMRTFSRPLTGRSAPVCGKIR